ncbi:hypothetical protein JCM17845_29100 [Iodidimonas gelatinilytica]|uniref:DUF3320 domain-containing protein n=1 Tax=Iodidimonas gelatinilytica TaxID=1236966 RepID=A0A5A7N2R5_9PROT|nr:DUF3320 domain-containing protein [Iodidimonas gelatinilytica]GER02287.1 hypothetical protein JCM17845_29100 [Iodidimonas gelatinilytica]
MILENLGWRLLRLWSTDYFINPQASIEALSAKLHALVEEGVCKDAGAENQEAAIITLNEDAVNEIKKSQAENNTLSESQGREPFDDELSDDAFPIENSLERKVSSLDVSVGDEINLYPSRFYDDDYRPTIRTFASDFIENHGPITFRYLANAIAREHGFKRTARKIREVVEASVKGLKSQSNSLMEKLYSGPMKLIQKNLFRSVDPL